MLTQREAANGNAPHPREWAPIYLEHVMKAGGSEACEAHCRSRQCPKSQCMVKYAWPLRMRNCRMGHSLEPLWNNATGHRDFRDASISTKAVANGMERVWQLCGIIANEPASPHHRLGDMLRFDGSDHPFWTAYTTVLLVRDPVDRFLSHVHMVHADMSLVLNSTRQLGPIGDNFLSRHLVPGFSARGCNNQTLHHALGIVNRFDVVLNIVDHWEWSSLVANALLNWTLTPPPAVAQVANSSQSEMRPKLPARFSGRAPDIHASASPTWLMAFKKQNYCDIELVASANARLAQLAGQVRQTHYSSK
jgi:hypothetical protein